MEKDRDRPAAAKVPARPRRSLKSEGGRVRLRVAVTDGRGVPVRADRLRRWLVRVAPARARGTITVALVSDRQIRRLNRQYRHVDRSTDVLSFPAHEAHEAKASSHGGASSHRRHLGDLAISVDTTRRQASEMGHSVAAELRVLALHGLLHLLGYDHERDRGEMARLERRLRRRGGLAHALTERS